jgi:hypothetical protein
VNVLEVGFKERLVNIANAGICNDPVDEFEAIRLE